MRFILFICFFAFPLLTFSQSFIHELEAPLNVNFDGNQESLRAGQQVVLETPIDSLLRETVEIREAYSSQGRVVSIRGSEFLLAISEQIEEQLDLVAPSGDSLVTFYNGGRFAFISLHDEADDPYVGLVEINEEGQILDELGEVAESDYPIYRINANEYNRLSLRHQFRRFNDDGLNPIPLCIPVYAANEDTVRPVKRPVSPYAPTTSLVPEPRPTGLRVSTNVNSDFPGLHSSFFELGARDCVNFIQNNGELGNWGEIISEYVQDESNRELFFNNDIPQMDSGANVCPNWSSFSDEQKVHFWAWVFAAIAWDESKCRQNERNLDGTNSVAVGLLQMEEPRSERAWRPGTHCLVPSVAEPRANILCGLDIMRELLRGPNGIHEGSGAIFSRGRTTSYWEKLRENNGSTIGARILTYGPCRN